MQLYWHTKAPNYAPLHSVPDNRVYVSRYEANNFVRRWLHFSHGKVVSDNPRADAGVIGRPGETIRRDSHRLGLRPHGGVRHGRQAAVPVRA